MAQREIERTVRLSVIDRLVDTEPRNAADAPLTWSESVRRLKASVLRDIEWLLNTRRIIEPAPAGFPELQSSLFHYGLPDITSLSADSAETRRELARQVEECVELFEPRLTGVRVLLVTDTDQSRKHRVRFRIEGLLRMDPNPERVVFDTVLETASGKFDVSGADHA
jgi:type VI secretion system protein ImpF